MWEQIQANRRRSAIFITCMMAVLLLLGYLAGEAIAPGAGPVGLLVALIIWAVQMLVYLTAAESILLGSAHAIELSREDCPRLCNIVEEMKIASGLGFMPRIFLIDDPTPNAFAVGRKPATSAVVVTSGLLHRLNRDELQGVIGHEIGHLKNHDVRFMTLAAVLLGSIILLAELFTRGMRGAGRGRSRSSSRGGGQAQLIILLVAVLFVILAPILARLLYFACSRRREYLADASSAQFTRYPAGLASALEKIGAAQGNAGFASQATAAMFIVNPLQASAAETTSLFSTHPPTTERVRILRCMAGAGLGDYEAAFHRVRGSQSPLIGTGSLQESPHQEPRADVGETEEGFALRDVRSMVHRLDGYLPVTCSCGLMTKVPAEYGQDEVRCIRCGKVLTLPAARTAATGTPAPATAESALQYARQSAGWESFRCSCGHTLQLSPSFCATHLKCNHCGRRIEIAPTSA